MKPITAILVPTVLIAAVGVGMWLAPPRRSPVTNLRQIAANGPVLTVVDVEKLLAKPCELVLRVKLIPSSIKQSYINVTGLPFDMNDPGSAMSTDYLIPGVPTRQLVFAGISDDSAVVVYKQGGYADRTGVVVLSSVGGGSAWWAYLDGRPPKDIPSLQELLKQSKFELAQKTK